MFTFHAWKAESLHTYIIPMPPCVVADKNSLKPPNIVPMPHKPNRDMYAIFEGSVTPVAEQYTTRAKGSNFCSSSTAKPIFVGCFIVFVGTRFFALWPTKYNFDICHMLDMVTAADYKQDIMSQGFSWQVTVLFIVPVNMVETTCSILILSVISLTFIEQYAPIEILAAPLSHLI